LKSIETLSRFYQPGARDRRPKSFCKNRFGSRRPGGPDERAELEGLMRSTMTHYRTRFKARTVLMAADGVATRAIAREVNRAIGTAAKGRVRYAQDRAIEADD